MKTLRNKSMKSLLLATVFTLGMYQPAYAATIDATGAAALQQEMTEALEDFKMMMAIPETAQSGLKVLGDVEVTPKAGFYAVVFPVLELRLDADMRIDFGQLKMNMKPEGADEWKYSMLLPSKMSVLNQNGDEMAALTIGKQLNQGVWNAKYDFSSQSKVMMRDIVLSTPEAINSIKFNAKIDSIENVTNLKRDDQNLYSGPQEYKMTNLVVSFDDAKSEGNFRINEISGDAHVEGMSLDVVENSKKLNGLLQEIGEKTANEAQAQALMVELGHLIRSFGTLLKSGSSSIAVKGMSGHINDQMGVERTLNVDRFGMKFTADSLDQAKGDVGFVVDVVNAVATPMPAEAAQFSPINTRFDFSLRDVPLQELLNFAADNINGATPDVAMQAIEILRRAMTELRIADTVFAFGDYQIEVDTQVKPNASGAPMPVAKMTIGVVGMDALLAELQGKQQAGTATNEEQQMLGGLAMVQQMGQNGTSAKSGKPLRQYVFETQADGRMFLNGSDIQPMIGMFMGQAMGVAQ